MRSGPIELNPSRSLYLPPYLFLFLISLLYFAATFFLYVLLCTSASLAFVFSRPYMHIFIQITGRGTVPKVFKDLSVTIIRGRKQRPKTTSIVPLSPPHPDVPPFLAWYGNRR